MTASAEEILRHRLEELSDAVRERDELVRAIHAGEVDALVVLKNDDAEIQRVHSDEPLYRLMLNEVPQAVATVLLDGTIVYHNRRLGELAASGESSLIGAPLMDYVHPSDAAVVQALVREAADTGRRVEAAVTTRGDAAVLLSATRLPILEPATVSVVLVDLRDVLARRTAEEVARAKDDVVAAVSHELRTPLTSMVGWVQLLEWELADDPRAGTALENLRNAVTAQIRIVDDLLDLAHTQRGTMKLHAQRFDLRSAVSSAVAFIALPASSKNVSLDVDLPATELPCHGDPDRIRQIFSNLLSNSLKFTPEGGTVAVTARAQDGRLNITVADTGLGISSDFLPFVFEPFRRGDDTGAYPGLGLGLAIARRIVEAHGGTMTVHSPGPDRGTTFTVTLPLPE